MLAAVHRWILRHDDSKAFIVLYIGLAVVLAIWLGLFWLAMVVGVHLLLELVKQHHYDPRPLPMITRSLWELKLDLGLVVCGLVIGLYIDVLFGIVGLGNAGRAGAQAAARVGLWQRGLRGVLLTVDDVAIVAKGVAGRKRGEEAEAEATLAATGTDDGVSSAGAALPDASSVAGPADFGTAETPADATPPGSVPTTDAATPAGSVPSADAPPDPLRPASPPTGGAPLWGGWLAPKWPLGDRLSLGFTVVNVALLLAAPLLTDHTVASTWAEVLADLHPFPDD